MREISWLAEVLLDFQKEICSYIYLFIYLGCLQKNDFEV
jgi:hypothetical protein